MSKIIAVHYHMHNHHHYHQVDLSPQRSSLNRKKTVGKIIPKEYCKLLYPYFSAVLSLVFIEFFFCTPHSCLCQKCTCPHRSNRINLFSETFRPRNLHMLCTNLFLMLFLVCLVVSQQNIVRVKSYMSTAWQMLSGRNEILTLKPIVLVSPSPCRVW